MENNRRRFLKQAAWASASVGLLPGLASGEAQAAELVAPSAEDKVVPQPSAAQKKWMSLGFGMFIHFGINTYYDVEWSDGTLDPIKYNPTELDTDQWCSTAKAAGMKYIVLVTKHHDGFCNWPTAYTDYSVKKTPFGKDLVRLVVDSARKHGLEVGFYYSLWDRHEPTHDKDELAYVQFMKNQLTELLTNYGPIAELWFDGMWKKQRTGWKNAQGKKSKPEEFMQAWRNEGAYRWQMDHLYTHVKGLQPDIMVMNNGTTDYPGVPLFPVDIRSGEKATGTAKDQKIWSFAGEDRYLPLQIETTMSRQGRDKVFKSGSWFWHDWDHSVASKEMIQEWLATAKRLEANLLLNCGPMSNGKLRPEDVAVLTSLQK